MNTSVLAAHNHSDFFHSDSIVAANIVSIVSNGACQKKGGGRVQRATTHLNRDIRHSITHPIGLITVECAKVLLK